MPHRSPIIFWLLLAATLAADTIVLKLAADQRDSSLGYLSVAVHMMILGQLSIVCIWSALESTPSVWTQIAPFCAVALAALVDGLYTRLGEHYSDLTTLTTSVGFFALYAVMLMTALWLLQRTVFWRRKTGSAHAWQFSLFHILTLMTIVAVLATLLRTNLYFRDGRWPNFIITFSYVALTTASVVIWACSWNWFFRLAGVMGVSLIFGLGASAVLTRWIITPGVNVNSILCAQYLIQAIVLSLWLGIGPILPSKIAAGETK